MLLLWNKNKALWINQEKSKWSPYYQYHLSFQRLFIFTSFVLIGNSCTSRIWCLQINTWLWFDWRPLENILFIRYIMSLALNLKNIKCSQFILNTDMKSLHELWPIHDMFNCTINVVFIWYPELQCMVTM